MGRREAVRKIAGEQHIHYYGLTDYNNGIPLDDQCFYRLWQGCPSGAWTETTTKTEDDTSFVIQLTDTVSLSGDYTLEMKLTNPALTAAKDIERVQMEWVQ